eukprot:5638963-Amphidinium_carterae.2
MSMPQFSNNGLGKRPPHAVAVSQTATISGCCQNIEAVDRQSIQHHTTCGWWLHCTLYLQTVSIGLLVLPLSCVRLLHAYDSLSVSWRHSTTSRPLSCVV